MRGAYNLIANVPEVARAKGVVWPSAGNHAQGIAFSGAALGIPGRVPHRLMPYGRNRGRGLGDCRRGCGEQGS